MGLCHSVEMSSKESNNSSTQSFHTLELSINYQFIHFISYTTAIHTLEYQSIHTLELSSNKSIISYTRAIHTLEYLSIHKLEYQSIHTLELSSNKSFHTLQLSIISYTTAINHTLELSINSYTRDVFERINQFIHSIISYTRAVFKQIKTKTCLQKNQSIHTLPRTNIIEKAYV